MKTANLTKLLAPLFGLALLAGCNKAEEPPKPQRRRQPPATWKPSRPATS